MRYVGGKSRVASAITKAIVESTPNQDVLYEPFAGGASMTAKLAPHFRRTIASDSSADLILMWSALRDGWQPPETITEDEYAALKTAPPSPLRSLAGFGGSFGGKWFGGYARGGFTSSGEPRNHQGESARAVTRIRDTLAPHDVTFLHRDYRDIRPNAGDVIYCDPPYANTQGYGAVGAFNSNEFWAVAEQWHAAGARVFVSEYTAPDGWLCIWAGQHRRSLNGGAERKVTEERLFTLPR